jgi:hypothetical protein
MNTAIIIVLYGSDEYRMADILMGHLAYGYDLSEGQ